MKLKKLLFSLLLTLLLSLVAACHQSRSEGESITPSPYESIYTYEPQLEIPLLLPWTQPFFLLSLWMAPQSKKSLLF